MQAVMRPRMDCRVGRQNADKDPNGSCLSRKILSLLQDLAALTRETITTVASLQRLSMPYLSELIPRLGTMHSRLSFAVRTLHPSKMLTIVIQ